MQFLIIISALFATISMAAPASHCGGDVVCSVDEAVHPLTDGAEHAVLRRQVAFPHGTVDAVTGGAEDPATGLVGLKRQVAFPHGAVDGVSGGAEDPATGLAGL